MTPGASAGTAGPMGMTLTPWVRRLMIGTAVMSITGALAHAWLSSPLPAALLLVPGEVVGGTALWPGVPALWQPLTYPFFIISSPITLLFTIALYGWFAGALESWWGSKRFLRFFAILILAPALLTVALSRVWPALLAIPIEGPTPALEGLVIAWGLTFRDREIRLFFVLPIKGIHLVWFTLGLTALFMLYAGSVAPFVPVLIGMALGAAIVLGVWRPRRLVLMIRKWSIERQIASERAERKARVAGAHHLHVANPEDGSEEDGGSDPSPIHEGGDGAPPAPGSGGYLN